MPTQQPLDPAKGTSLQGHPHHPTTKTIKARLKYRLHSGGVKFWYELDRPERAVEDAFAGYINQVRETSGYTVLVGQA